jgi:hypothetical protein
MCPERDTASAAIARENTIGIAPAPIPQSAERSISLLVHDFVVIFIVILSSLKAQVLVLPELVFRQRKNYMQRAAQRFFEVG